MRTRDALIEAAVRLFAAQGYDHTAVHEITDAVDASERTVAKRLSTPATVTGG
jgi:AcrR family transcriptional regulator